MFNKFEILVAGSSVFFMGLALYLVQVESVLFEAGVAGQSAQVIESKLPGVIMVNSSDDVYQSRTDTYLKAVNNQGNFVRMVIDDVKFGNGEEVKKGDKVSVHYVGALKNGEEFDNSRKRGEPFEFTVGGGQVIKGWDEGLVGMKVGGSRVLVVPAEMAYGDAGVGPIPGGATLVFAIELVSID